MPSLRSIPSTRANRRRRRPGAAPRRAAFTLVELVIGMVVTTLIMSAIAALMGAVGRGWEQSLAAQNSTNLVFQFQLRLQRLFRGARQIGAYRVGSIEGGGGEEAAVLFWMGDANGDGVMQYSEVALLEHRSGAQLEDCQLALYQIKYPAGMSAADVAANDQPADSEKDDWIYDKNGQSAIDLFKNQPYFDPEPTVVAKFVTGCEFHPVDGATVTRPCVSYLVNLQKSLGGTAETEYGTIAVRNAAPLPLSQRGG